MGVGHCSMFCCTLLYVHSSIAIILMGKRELVALLSLSFWCLVMVEWLFLMVPCDCLQFVIVVFPDHTYLLFTRKQVFILNFKMASVKLHFWHGTEAKKIFITNLAMYQNSCFYQKLHDFFTYPTHY